MVYNCTISPKITVSSSQNSSLHFNRFFIPCPFIYASGSLSHVLVYPFLLIESPATQGSNQGFPDRGLLFLKGGQIPQQRARLLIHRHLHLVAIGHRLDFFPDRGKEN